MPSPVCSRGKELSAHKDNMMHVCFIVLRYIICSTIIEYYLKETAFPCIVHPNIPGYIHPNVLRETERGEAVDVSLRRAGRRFRWLCLRPPGEVGKSQVIEDPTKSEAPCYVRSVLCTLLRS